MVLGAARPENAAIETSVNKLKFCGAAASRDACLARSRGELLAGQFSALLGRAV